jgi:kynurenine formamidase
MSCKQTDIGALLRIGSAHVREAVGLVRHGRVYDLGLEINDRMPQGPREAFVPFSMAFSTTPEGSNPGSPFQFAAEVVIGALHTSTHIDAFVHVQSHGRAYGDALGSEIRNDRGFVRNGAETIPPIVARGLVLDIAGLRGVPMLQDGYEVTIADVQEALAAHDLHLSQGDVVLVRTGKLREFWTDPESFQAGQPGVGRDAAVWLFEQGMVVLGTDTAGTEPLPFPDITKTTHCAMLVERGVHLVENVQLDEVTRDGVAQGLFICLPLRITGATGSWVRPILVV